MFEMSDFHGSFGDAMLPSSVVRSTSSSADGAKRVHLNRTGTQNLGNLLNQLPERSQVYTDPDPHALWFHVAGSLKSIYN